MSIRWARLPSRHRQAEFASFLARGNSKSPPLAAVTLSSVLISPQSPLLAFRVRLRLPVCILRVPGRRPDYLQAIVAPPALMEGSSPRKELMRYLRLEDTQLSSFCSARRCLGYHGSGSRNFLPLQVVLQRKTPFPGRYLEGSDKGAPEPGFFCGHHAWSLESVITVSARIFLTQGPLSSRPRKPLGARGIMIVLRREISASGS